MSISALAGVIGMGILLHSFENSLDVVLEKAVIKAGESVTINVKYKNNSTVAITLKGAGGGEGFTPLFRIADAANNVVCEGGQRLKGGIFSMKPLTLRPGEIAEKRLVLNRWCDTYGLLGKYTVTVRHLDFVDQSLNVQRVVRLDVEQSDANIIARHARRIFDKICNSNDDVELGTLVSELAYSGSPTAVALVSELVLPSGKHYLKNVSMREDAIMGLATIRTKESIDLLSKMVQIPDMKAVALDAMRRMYGDITIAKKPAESNNISKRLEHLLARYATR